VAKIQFKYFWIRTVIRISTKIEWFVASEFSLHKNFAATCCVICEENPRSGSRSWWLPKLNGDFLVHKKIHLWRWRSDQQFLR